VGEREKLRELTESRPEMAELVEDALALVAACRTAADLEATRVKLLGKKGVVTSIFKGLSLLPPEEKPAVGQIGNLLRGLVEERLKEKTQALEEMESEKLIDAAPVDVTLPGRRFRVGRKHLLTQVVEEITSIFLSLGYQVVSGPEVELDYYNFEALNQPAHHPARSLHDTFYIKRTDPNREYPDDILLRTHTSPVQVRVMESKRPPLYVISPGKAYRRDEIDATHTAMFHQIEGFAVDTGINMGHLKGTLEVFAKKLFGAERKLRFRPHFFPFTEPSAEVDVSCHMCGGDGGACSLCKGSGWLEILGCGMIDPSVFEYVGYDPEEYTGFAFGVGIERVAILKYGIEDLRVFFENDARFLRQF
jgi:phenylalanyl-tRNA synthetase alpha chain